jgi:hypothetical protein
MYCPNCGAQSAHGLNYCKLCGANLSEANQGGVPPARNIFAALILALATTGIVLGGLAIVFSFAIELVGPHASPGRDATAIAGMMVLFGSSAVILATFLLIKLFARLMGLDSIGEKSGRASKALANERRARQLSAPPASLSSVTEHTTRNFEPQVYRPDSPEQ